MTYKQLTYEERIILITLKQQGISTRKIAQQLGRHFATIYRGLNCNRCNGIDTACRALKSIDMLLLEGGVLDVIVIIVRVTLSR